MTNTKTPSPSDAEILALFDPRNGAMQGLNEVALRFARAVLAKWGTPPAGAGKPVAWRYVPSKVWGEFVYTEDPKRAQYARDNGIDVQPVFTTPQPTQAQAGAVPLTEQQINEMWYDQWDGFVSFAEAEVIVRATEEAHGIKGGQHVGKVD